MPIAPKISNPIIPQDGGGKQQISVEDLAALATRFRPILQEIFEDKWFPHTQIAKHVSQPYKDTETVLSIVQHWKKGGVLEVSDQSKPGGERSRIFCRFVQPLPSIADDLDSYLALFKVNTESGNEQARYHGYRIVIHKPKNIDNTNGEWSYILNHPGERGGSFCTDLFATPEKAKIDAYIKIHKALNKTNQENSNEDHR